MKESETIWYHTRAWAAGSVSALLYQPIHKYCLPVLIELEPEEDNKLAESPNAMDINVVWIQITK